jgi:dTDP-4-dehydrorhamnose reductase
MANEPLMVVFGADGQLGRALAETPLPAGWRLRGLARGDADITDSARVDEALSGITGGLVVNVAAYTAVDRAESEPAAAFAINRDGAGIVAAAAARRKLPVLHISTDAVFDGSKQSPYVEDDAAAPLSVYSASKLAGEAEVLAHPRSLVLRTAWLFSAQGKSFVRTILGLARQRDELGVVDDQLGSPTPAGGVAAAIMALAPRLRDGDGFGLFHYGGVDAASWYDLAAAVLAEAASQGAKVARLRPIPTSAYPTPARRPAYAVLSSARIEAVHGILPPPWRLALPEVVARLLR